MKRIDYEYFLTCATEGSYLPIILLSILKKVNCDRKKKREKAAL